MRSRPALAQTFQPRHGGSAVTIVVNHLKSKGSPCDDLGDPDIGDGQGNCNRTRTRATQALVDWLAVDPTASGNGEVLIIGDLNAYLREDPLRTLEQAGYHNLIARGDAPVYSFVFRGEFGALDHALASAPLLPRITGAAVWHINADEVPLIDYNLEQPRNPAWFSPQTVFRASDHDPLIIGLELGSDP